MFELAVVALVAIYSVREYTNFKEKQQLMAERSELLNRIKPETAQLAWGETPELIDPVRSDDDYWEAHEKQIKDEGTFPFGGEEEALGR